MISDEALYRRLRCGDEAALEVLVHRYHSPLLGFLYRQTGDRHLAEDLVQETFTRLVSYQGEPPQQFRPWVFAIAVNLARDHFRSAYHRREQPAADPAEPADQAPAAPPAGVDELLLRDQERREVVAALHRLSPSHRAVLILRFYHGLKLEEIAAATAAPLGTVKSRLFHALKQMQAHLGRKEGCGDVPEAREPHRRSQR